MDPSWPRIASRDFDMRGQFDAVFHTHVRFASQNARNIWRTWANHVSAQKFDLADSLVPDIEHEVTNAFLELKETLRQTHPLAATWLLFGERADPIDMHSYVTPKGGDTYSIARGAWIIGAFGNGESSDRTAAYAAFNKYVRWCSAFLAHCEMHSFKARPERRTLGGKIAALRNLDVETHMRWITDEICDSLGAWVDAYLSDKKGVIGSHVMRIVSTNALESLRTMGPLLRAHKGSQVQLPLLERTVSEQLLLGVPDETQAAVTTPPQGLSDRTLTLALKGEGPELYPLVRVGDRTLVLNRSAWLVQRDRSMLNAVMGMVPSDREGEPLEQISKSLLQRWGPPDLTWTVGKVIAPRTGSGSDEIDLLGLGEGIAIIGECKANRLSKNDQSLDANFEERVLNKAATQVYRRLDHWKEGWRPPGLLNSEAGATGLVITLSSYAGGVWSEPNLHFNGEVADTAIFPLHALMLALAATPDAASLTAYLNWRTRILKQGLVSSDELELVLTFGSQGPIVPKEEEDDTPITFRNYELSANAVAELDPRPYLHHHDWRSRYFANIWECSHPVSSPL